MLDVTNGTLNSLLMMSGHENKDPEPITSLKEEQEYDDDKKKDNGLDPSTFVLLFAQILSTSSEPEKTNKSECHPVLLNPNNPITQSDVLESKILTSMDDNIAVAWCNSAYYKSDTDTDTDLVLITKPDTPLEAKKDSTEWAIQSVESKDVSSADKAPVLIEHQENIINSFFKDQPPQKNNSGINLEAIEVEDTVAEEVTPFIAVSNEIHVMQPLESQFGKLSDNLTTPKSEPEVVNDLIVDEGHKEPQNNSPVLEKKSFIEKSNVFSSEIDIVVTSEEVLSKKPTVLEIPETLVVEDHHIQLRHDENSDSLLINNFPNNIHASSSERLESKSYVLATAVNSFNLPTNIDDPQWSRQFSEHIIWLGQQGIKSALIKIHPEELGPLEINIKVSNNLASISIASHSEYVRTIIEQSLPKLQEMLTAQGLGLAETTTHFEQGERQSEQNAQDFPPKIEDVTEEDRLKTLKTPLFSQGLVDYFA